MPIDNPVTVVRPNPLWTAYEYLAMALGLSFLALLCLVWLPFALLMRPILPGRPGRRFGRRMIMGGFRLYLGFLRLFCATRFDLAAIDQLRDAPPRVLIANHPSLLDAVMIVSRLPNVVCVMKASLMRNILLGSAARLAGYIPNDGPLEVVLHAGRALDEGAHVLLFPEGSRTSTATLDRFTTSAALIARRSRVPIQSLLIRFAGTTPEPYLGKHWPLWRKPDLPMHWHIDLDRCFEPPGRVAAEPAQTVGEEALRQSTTALTQSMEDHLRQRLSTTAA